MSAPHDIPDPAFRNRGVMFWLPPTGFGNGIAATAWAILADLAEDQVADVLFALSDAGIGGHVAPAHTTRLLPGQDTGVYRLWVDSLHYHQAEDLVMQIFRDSRRSPGDAESP